MKNNDMKLDDIFDKLSEVGYESREELVADLEGVFRHKFLGDMAEVLRTVQFQADRQIQDAISMNDEKKFLESVGAYNGIEITLAVLESRPMVLKSADKIKKEPLH